MSPDSIPNAKADILIIDDTPDNLRLLSQMLSTSYKVRLAPSGEVGLTAARAMPPDLILLDVMMPGLNGYEIATQLKARPLTADIPIIFISALNDIDSKVRGFTVGGVDYVTKPFQEREVLARINTHLTLRVLHRQLQSELTARQQAEAALRESENKYRTIADFTYDWEFWLGPDGQYRYVSPACERITGYTPDEIQRSPHLVEELVHPDDRAAIAAHLKLDASATEPCAMEFRIIARDGAERWIEHLCQPVHDQAGRWLGRRGSNRDITARKQVENAWRDSQELFALFMRYSPIHAYIKAVTSTESRVLMASANFQDMIGFTAADMIGKSMAELFPADFAAKITADDWDVVSGGQVLKVDEDLNERNYTTIKYPIVQGNRTLLAGYTIDITERKQVEEALRAANANLETLIQVSPLAITLLDINGHVQLWNHAAERIFGWTAQEVIGQPNPIVPPDRQNEYTSWSSHILQGTALANVETVRQRKDGTLIDVSLSSAPVYDAAGNVTGRMAIVADITERKRTEAALRESEAKYHKIFNNEIDAICIFDVETRQILDVNNAYLKLYGYTRDEALTLTTDDISTDVEQTNAAIQLAQAAGDLVIPERQHRRKDGTMIQVELSAGAYTWNGRNVMFAIARDITARTQAEAQREAALMALRELNAQLEQRVAERTRDLTSANERLAELSSLKTEFITRISHELRTPLANIKLYLQLLEHGKPEKREPYFQTLHEQTDRLQHLIEDLLDISQLSFDEIGVHATTFEVNALLRELISDSTALALEHGLTLMIVPTADRPTLNTDRSLLRQALSNVLTNALNYTPQSGQVTLRTDRVAMPEGDWLAIQVRDTGPGISEHDLPHIFEPFYRGAAAADYKIPGTGVGLSVAQHLIERLGGRITVESSPGQGTTFTLWLNTATA